LQKMFGEQNKTTWDLSVTDSLTPCVCSLPIHTEMDQEQLAHIVEGVQSFFKA
jgi:UDP-2-acetamido-2-deoxy-ribo-hexuluronate aminotransferase